MSSATISRKPKRGVLAGAVLAAAVIGVGAENARATNYYWANTTSTTPPTSAQNWTIGSNWSPSGGPPGAGDNAYVSNGGVALINSSVSASSALVGNSASGGSLYIDNGGTLTLSSTNNPYRNYAATSGNPVINTTIVAGGSLLANAGYIGVGTGTFNSAGTVSGVGVNISGSAVYNMTGGTLTTSQTYQSLYFTGAGTFNQTGGATTLTNGSLCMNGGTANTVFQISGGSFAAQQTSGQNGIYFSSATKNGGTIAVVGSGASSVKFGGVRYNATDRSGIVWSFTLDNGTNHITPITFTGNGNNTNSVRQGTLDVNLNGGVLLSGTNTFNVINTPTGTALGGSNYATQPGPLWSAGLTATNGSGTNNTVKVTLTGTAGVDKGTIDASGTKAQTFTAASYGYVDLANIGTSPFDLYLNATGGTLSNFTSALTTAGVTNTSGSYTFGAQNYNVKLTLNPSVSGNTEFAWDLSNVDPSMSLDSISLFQSASHSASFAFSTTAAGSAMVGTANPGNITPSSTITVTGNGNGSYNAGYLNSITANGNDGHVQINGFSDADSQIAALSITVDGSDPTPAQLAEILTDLGSNAMAFASNSAGGSFGTSLQSTNLAAYNALIAGDVNYGSNPFQIALLNPSGLTPGSPTYLNIDFSNEIDAGAGISNVQVTNIAAIPEPASLLLVGLVAVAALPRRRRKIIAKD